ncbi:hypothetical protein ACHAPJ_009095 [Fusarium lateritium]
MPSKKEYFKCETCNKEAYWTKSRQERHVKTHILVDGNMTFSQSERHESCEKSRKEFLERYKDQPDELAYLVRRVLQLKESRPVEFRHKGGRFEAGPLQDLGHTEGMPEMFYTSGGFKPRFGWMLDFNPALSGSGQAFQPTLEPSTMSSHPSSHADQE